MIDWKPVSEWKPEAETVLAWIVDHSDGPDPKAVFVYRHTADDWNSDPEGGGYYIPGYLGDYTITHFAPINGPDGKPQIERPAPAHEEVF